MVVNIVAVVVPVNACLHILNRKELKILRCCLFFVRPGCQYHSEESNSCLDSHDNISVLINLFAHFQEHRTTVFTKEIRDR